MAIVERSPARLERLVDSVRALVDTYLEATVVRWDLEMMEMEL